MKKLLSVLLFMFMTTLVLPCIAAENGTGALHDTPFGIKGKQTDEGFVIQAVAQASLITAEECDFLGILYLELNNEEIDIKDIAALRNAFSIYPDRIKTCYDMELCLPWEQNMTVIAAPFYRVNREPYYRERLQLGHHAKSPWVFRNDEGVEDYVAPNTEECYDSIGAEINVEYDGIWNSNKGQFICYDLDYDLTIPAVDSVTPFIGMYGSDGGLIKVDSPFYRTKTPIDGGDKLWLHLLSTDNPAVCKSVESVDYFRAYVWDENLRPIAASPMTAVSEAELSVKFTEANAEIIITQENVHSAVIYGPSKHIFGGSRYLRTLESHDITEDKAVTLAEKGRYLVVLTDSRGVEYKRIIDNF